MFICYRNGQRNCNDSEQITTEFCQLDMETHWRLATVSQKIQLFSAIAYEVYKTLNDLNPNFTKKIFNRFPNLTHRKDNPIFIPET